MLQHGACASAREDTGDDAAARGKQQRNYKDREQGKHDQRPSGYVAECDRCLHAGMDIYKWTMKLGPLVPGELLLDTFDLALDIGRVDMQASPYDVSEYGLPPVKIETPEGKSEYAAMQRGFMERGNALRVRVLDAITRARESAAA